MAAAWRCRAGLTGAGDSTAPPTPEAPGPSASSQHLFYSSFRSSAIQVQALDGASSGPLQFHTAQERADWLRMVSANISDLMLRNVSVETVPVPGFAFQSMEIVTTLCYLRLTLEQLVRTLNRSTYF